MNLKPNQHKIISFNTTTMTSMGFIGPPLNLAPPKFFAQVHPNCFGLTFLAPPPKIKGAATMETVILVQLLAINDSVKTKLTKKETS